MAKKIKVMAYYKSTGIWNGCRQVKIRKILKYPDETLQEELAAWQASYDDTYQ